MRLVYKFFTPLFLTLGLVACGDSSSNAAPDTLKCVVKSENPLVMESSFNGTVSKTKIELRDGIFQHLEHISPSCIQDPLRSL